MSLMTTEEESKLICCLLKAAMKLDDETEAGICAGEYLTVEEWKTLSRWILWPRTAHQKMFLLRLALGEALEELADGSYTHGDDEEAWPAFEKEMSAILKVASDQINTWKHAYEADLDCENSLYEQTKEVLDPDNAGEYKGDTV